jgi:hypothetical protein
MATGPIPTQPLDPSVNAEAIKKANAEAILKVESQGLDIHTSIPAGEDVGNTKAALSALRAEAKKNAPEVDELEVVPAVTPEVVPAVTPAVTTEVVPAVTAPTETDEQKIAREKTEAEQVAKFAEEKKLADEIFKGAPSLPPNASVKSATAFDAIKTRAAQEIRARDQQLIEARAELEEAKAASSKPLTAEVEQELTALREFRAKLDVDLDPKFKEFDTKLAAAHAFVYAQLSRSPNITPEIVEKIKSLGGPDQVKMEPILDSVNDPVVRRLVEAKLAEAEMIRYDKGVAVDAAKKNVKEYMAAREQEMVTGGQNHTHETKQHLDGMVAKIGWLQPVPVDDKASVEDKKKAKDHNAYAAKINSEIAEALQNDTPVMRAAMITGMAQLFRLQNLHEVVAKDYTRVQKDLDQANETIKRLTSASKTRLATSAAPAAGIRPVAPPALNVNESAKDALQRLRKEQLAAGAAA